MAISRNLGNPAPQTPRRSLINDPNARAVFFQILVLGGVALLGWYLVSNVLENLARQNIATGFSSNAGRIRSSRKNPKQFHSPNDSASSRV